MLWLYYRDSNKYASNARSNRFTTIKANPIFMLPTMYDLFARAHAENAIITIEMMFADVNVIGSTQAKMSSETGQKHIYAQEHELYFNYNNSRGHSQK